MGVTEVGDLVWARVQGHPQWPGQVGSSSECSYQAGRDFSTPVTCGVCICHNLQRKQSRLRSIPALFACSLCQTRCNASLEHWCDLTCILVLYIPSTSSACMLCWTHKPNQPLCAQQVMDPNMAPLRAQHNAKKGTVLVSFFGDSSYGWYEHHLLSEFWAKFEENSQQKEKKKVGTNWHHAASHSAQMRPHTSIIDCSKTGIM